MIGDDFRGREPRRWPPADYPSRTSPVSIATIETGLFAFLPEADPDVAKVSAGILLYRRRDGRLEVLLVHPGGPFWAKKDRGVWSIPKGETEPGEDLLARAVRELHEETGFAVEGPFTQLVPVRQPGKLVHAWAAEGDGDPSAIVSNTFEIEYPPRSGRLRTFPEVDEAGWFDLPTAREKLLTGQRDLLDQLERLLKERE